MAIQVHFPCLTKKYLFEVKSAHLSFTEQAANSLANFTV
jgi:hypothetical protein